MKAQTRIDLALIQRRLAPWRARWERQAKRIDALSLRERAILFLSIVAVLAALFDTLWMSPLAARARLRGQLEAQQASELTRLREAFVIASRSGSEPAGELRAQVEAARVERARLDEQLRSAASLQAGDGLSKVLQRLLAQQPGLVLERLTLLPDTPVTMGAAPASAPAGSRADPPTVPGMSWQGVELQLQGRYADAQRYLQSLERELPGLRWGEMKLAASGGSGQPRLQAQLFLLKVQP